jgi:hypothetical protein
MEHKYNLGELQMDADGSLYRLFEGEKEYFNPPMVIDVEYRTVERWEGKAVYAYAFNPGYVTSGARSYPHGRAVAQPIHVEVFNRNIELVTGYSGITSLTVDQTSVNIECSNAFGNIKFYIKYTKK